jgi:hypothetical protein
MQIYKITNLENGLSYIGKDQSDNPYYMGSGLLIWNSYRKRFNNPSLSSDRRTDRKWVYQRNEELNLYEKTILAECDDPETLCELEAYYIDKYDTIRPNGYNIAEGGRGGCLIRGYDDDEMEEWKDKISKGVTDAMQREDVRERFLNAVQNKSESWRRNISKSLTGRKGKPMSEETKERLRQINKGNQHGIGNKSHTGMHNSEETNRKISEAQKKIVHTKEWNEKVGNALRGKPKSEETKQKLRKPKPKYEWQLPDGSTKIMDNRNGMRHDGWTRIKRIT